MRYMLFCLPGLLLVGVGGDAAAEGLPSAWNGTWRGPCTTEAIGATAPVRTFELEIDIQPLAEVGALSWRMTYRGLGREDVRPYVLRTVDAAAGHFAIDEGGGVLLDTFLLGNVLFSQFGFAGSTMLTAREELRGDRLSIEYRSHDEPALRTIELGDRQLTTHRFQSVQRCELSRQ